MLMLVLLSVVHVFMVVSVDPQSLRSMVTGYYDTRKSPERHNARPFYRSHPIEAADDEPTEVSAG